MKTKNEPSILGLDIGFSKFGISYLCNDSFESVALTLDEKKPQKSKQLPFIKEIFFDNHSKRDLLLDNIGSVNLVMIEKPFNVKGFGTALYELLGIVKYLCIKYGTPFCEIPQTTLKKFATGSGNAKKSEMVMSAYKDFGFEAKSEDEVDAFWCALAGDIMLRGKESIGYSKKREDSLKKLIIQYIETIVKGGKNE